MAFYSYLSTKIIIAFITKSYQDLFGVRSYINAKEKGKQSPDIGNLFPHFTEYIYYAITFYRYLCHKIVLLNLA